VIRCLDDDDVWMLTVEGRSSEGPVIGLVTHPTELEPRASRAQPNDVPPSAPEVTALLRLLGHEMAVRGHLTNPWTLYAANVRPEIWSRTEELTDSTDRYLGCYLESGDLLELPIRRTAAGEVLVALDQAGIAVFLGGDQEALCSIVSRYLVSGGFLTHPEDLRVEERRAAPPERLDPNEILTAHEDFSNAIESSAIETTSQEVAKP
jgi:hypothetical protein